LRPITQEEHVSFVLTAEEVERLAELEHARWASERRATSWVSGPVRDVEHRITPYLVPYAELPNDVKEWDRLAVRAIPEVLAAAGLKAQRRNESAAMAEDHTTAAKEGAA
jgi:hypothetical protein